MATLRELRMRRFLTQAELAEKTGVSESTVAGWEAGRKAPRLRNIRKLAEVLGVEPGEIQLVTERKSEGGAKAA